MGEQSAEGHEHGDTADDMGKHGDGGHVDIENSHGTSSLAPLAELNAQEDKADDSHDYYVHLSYPSGQGPTLSTSKDAHATH